VFYPITQVIYISLWNNYLTIKNPAFVGLGNYIWLLHQSLFSLIFSNTAIFTLASVLLHLVLGLGLASGSKSLVSDKPFRTIPMTARPGGDWGKPIKNSFGCTAICARMKEGKRSIDWVLKLTTKR
jgi:hypothetical protein